VAICFLGNLRVNEVDKFNGNVHYRDISEPQLIEARMGNRPSFSDFAFVENRIRVSWALTTESQWQMNEWDTSTLAMGA
jgi:hypothetical protein